ncbi:FAD dependent oxidoreductase [Beutenbergia cavernae DSM 12333]|uniref:FAD dependent oxidoreductase n=1 Tax=Beutenbergia cavernae (strain ATCC BAA-8 / DSM 12333 / CCUG 43141 / JCM 11478 / NBRC 16432 / NCIMB 13614 / HKI 0122) TaxID=471853 RepID=C5C0U3_BEUC1|nr:FAD-dependent oxidoreductase [Beutenbergia cavernae]ACQ79347.1 FAD dependent oxidoreductase [Beutenbergia cavernae DSM 12333]
MTQARPIPAPTSAVVVGAGMLGLATAHFLRRHGLEVRVLEAEHVAAGSSWGNAGWLTPSLTTPLPEPSILRAGVRALLSPASPVYAPVRADPLLLRFLVSFLRHSTWAAWRRSMAAYVPLNARALDAFDTLAAHGVAQPTRAALFVAAYRAEADRVPLLHEIELLAEAGQDVPHEVLDGDGVRALVPAASPRVEAGVRLDGTRFIDPPAYVAALADTVRADGVELLEGVRVLAVDGGAPGRPAAVAAEHADGRRERFDADVVVLATGARLGELTRGLGVRTVVQAGRGYSFTVPVEDLPVGPLYLPAQRVACTPLDGRLRVAGMMEFRRPGEPLDPRRIAAIVAAAEPLIDGADFTDRRSEWVGSRPCTPDGLPLVGPTLSPRVHVAGGHGMWGITLGPLTGQLLAEAIATGVVPDVLAPLDPLR